MYNKVSKNIGILRRLQNKLPVTFLRNLYFTPFNPYFEYCNIIWAISLSAVLVKLFCIQKRAIRLITNSEWNAHTAPLFHEFNILTIHQLNLHVASYCMKFITTYYHSISLIYLYLIVLFMVTIQDNVMIST